MNGEDSMALAPGRFDYAPITERPIIRWPGNARVAFWVAPNMEFFEYLPENRPTQPDIPHYSRMDYGNRVGFWRMLDVLNKNNVRACCCLNLELLDHFPEMKDAMVASNWDYMAHGLYNSRPIYDYSEEQERAYWEYIDDLRTPRAFSRPLARRARSRAPSSALGSQRTSTLEEAGFEPLVPRRRPVSSCCRSRYADFSAGADATDIIGSQKLALRGD
jgi:hypothetical protein